MPGKPAGAPTVTPVCRNAGGSPFVIPAEAGIQRRDREARQTRRRPNGYPSVPKCSRPPIRHSGGGRNPEGWGCRVAITTAAGCRKNPLGLAFSPTAPNTADQ